jgi:hypothetical protein
MQTVEIENIAIESIAIESILLPYSLINSRTRCDINRFDSVLVDGDDEGNFVFFENVRFSRLAMAILGPIGYLLFSTSGGRSIAKLGWYRSHLHGRRAIEGYDLIFKCNCTIALVTVLTFNF